MNQKQVLHAYYDFYPSLNCAIETNEIKMKLN